jgi:hypothetical protein
MAQSGTPDWWLDRLYKCLRDRQPRIRMWDDWYTGRHPLPQGYEKADAMLLRLLETIGLNMLALVTDAALDRMHVEGFKVNGQTNDDVWQMLQSNNFDLAAAQVLQEKMALSEAYMLVDPNPNRDGHPTVTPEHPEQAITESYPGSMQRAAGLKVWQDDLGDTPLIWAMVYLPDRVEAYAAPTRIYAQATNRSGLALKPSWEYQESMSGANPLGEVPLVPFSNRSRMLKAPEPEFAPAITPQRRINKTLMDRMAMQDQGAFKAMWATGLNIPKDPATNLPVEDFIKAIDRMFVNENPAGKFGQLEAEDIKQMLEAVRDDVADCAMVVPTSPDQILGKLVNVSGDGLKLAQVSEIKRVRRHMKFDEESFEEVARLTLKASGQDLPRVSSMTTTWRNPEYRTEGELSDAATKALANGVPHEAVWEKFYGATPDEIRDWRSKLDDQALSPGARAILGNVGAPNAGNGA